MPDLVKIAPSFLTADFSRLGEEVVQDFLRFFVVGIQTDDGLVRLNGFLLFFHLEVEFSQIAVVIHRIGIQFG